MFGRKEDVLSAVGSCHYFACQSIVTWFETDHVVSVGRGGT